MAQYRNESGQFAKKILDEWLAKTAEVYDELGQVIAEDLADLVSIPIGRRRGKPVRSKPGEPPRREHGDLAKSFRSQIVVHSESSISLEVYSKDKKARWLEEGTVHMDERPFMEPTWEKWKPVVADATIDNL